MIPPLRRFLAAAALVGGGVWLGGAGPVAAAETRPAAAPDARRAPPALPTAVASWHTEPRAGWHTELRATYPAADSLHRAPVQEIRLRFSTPVQLSATAITLLGPGGQVAASPVDTVAGSEGREVGLRLPEALPSGSYTVEWRTAGPDSHVIRGSYGFTVDRPDRDTATAAPPPPEAVVGPPPDGGRGASDALGVGGWLLNALFLASVVGMVGVVAFRAAVLRRLRRTEGLEPVAKGLDRRLTGLAWAVAVLAVGVMPFRLVDQARQLAGPDGSLLGAAGDVLGQTWGLSWILSVAAAALFIAGLLLARRGDGGLLPWAVAGVGALLMTLVPAFIGHSGGTGGLGITADALHVLSAGVWAGGLASLVLAGIPAAARGRADDGSVPALGPMVGSFSPMALGAVGLLVLSGIANNLQHMEPRHLLTTDYGRILGVKVLLALGAFALGFYNWRVVRPQLAETPRTRLVRIPTAVELVLAACVLAVTAALVATPTP